MKRSLSKTIFILVILLTFGESFAAEILRCEGRSAPTGPMPNSKVSFDIVMPIAFDSYLEILDRETKDFEGFSGMTGHGTIEIKKVSLKSERFPFLITRKPSAENQMYGFFIEGDIPVVIHIDTWKKRNHFLSMTPSISLVQLLQASVEQPNIVYSTVGRNNQRALRRMCLSQPSGAMRYASHPTGCQSSA